MWLRAFRSSIAGRIAAAVLISTILVTAAGSTAAFLVYRETALRGALDATLAYLQERRKTEERAFIDIRDTHAIAARLYAQRLQSLDRVAAARAFDRLFPLQPDGTRRSADALFDGGRAPDGVDTYGVGSFMADGGAMTVQEKAELYAAFLVMREMGPIIHPRVDNIYFFTPSDRMVMFAPDREDRLQYYRREAPASFAFQHEEFAIIARRAANPAARTLCTSLRSIISEHTEVRLSSACVTPVEIGARRVGAWGTSVTLAENLRTSLREALPGTNNAVLDRHGALIAHSRLSLGAAGRDAEQVAEELGVAQVMAHIQRSGHDSGVIPDPVKGNYIAFARIAGPDWIFLSLVPAQAASRHASQSAGLFLLIGALAVLAQVMLLAFLMYRWVVRPALRLTQAAASNGRLAIGELTHRQDELGQLARALAERDQRDAERMAALAEARASAEAANAAKSQFIAAMSHELRTPLNAIIGYSEIMREDAEASGRRSDIADHGRVLTAARRLLHLINEVLDLSKVESGRMLLDIEECNVVELARDAIDAVRPTADANGNVLTLDAPSNLPLGRSDNFKLGQCLLNLLSNACKFTRNGRISVRIRIAGERFVVEVEDTGVGIPAAALERLFQPFVQADASTARTFGGTGLGLAITRRMAQLMGGEVTVASVVGKGSLFTLSVAVNAAANDDAAPYAAAAELTA